MIRTLIVLSLVACSGEEGSAPAHVAVPDTSATTCPYVEHAPQVFSGLWQSETCPEHGSAEWPTVPLTAVVQVCACYDDGSCREYDQNYVRMYPAADDRLAVELTGCGDAGELPGFARVDVAWLEPVAD